MKTHKAKKKLTVEQFIKDTQKITKKFSLERAVKNVKANNIKPTKNKNQPSE